MQQACTFKMNPNSDFVKHKLILAQNEKDNKGQYGPEQRTLDN